MPDRDDQLDEPTSVPEQPPAPQEHPAVQALSEFQEAQAANTDPQPLEPDPSPAQAPPEIPAAPEIAPPELAPELPPTPTQNVIDLPAHARELGRRMDELREPADTPEERAQSTRPDDLLTGGHEPAPPLADPPDESPAGWPDLVQSTLARMAELGGGRKAPTPPPGQGQDGRRGPPPPYQGLPVDVQDETFPEYGGHDVRAEGEAAFRDSLRAVTNAQYRLVRSMAEMLLEHARQIDELFQKVERER